MGINLLRSNSISCEPATKESMATAEESGVPELSPVSVGPNARCGVHAEENISSMYHAVVVSPNEAYGAINKHEQATTGNRENNCVTTADVPPLDVSPNIAYSPHDNCSPRNALANAIVINPNEAYGVPAGVNVSSTNHPTDAAISINPNEAYGVHAGVNVSSTNHLTDAAISINPNEAYSVHAGVNVSSTNHPTDAAVVVNTNEAYIRAIYTHEEATTGNREDKCVAIETDCEYSYVTV